MPGVLKWSGKGPRPPPAVSLESSACAPRAVCPATPNAPSSASVLFNKSIATFFIEIPGALPVIIIYGNVLLRLGTFDAALAAFDRALVGAEDDAAAHRDRGRALKALARHDEARAAFETSISLDATDAQAHFELALSRLRDGDLPGGWLEYEWRWQAASMPKLQPIMPGPPWLGDGDIGGETILVQAEQGLGDQIQFSRYARLLAARGARVVLQVRPELRELLAGIEGVSVILAVGEPPPPGIDCRCPLMSLPLAVGTCLDTIPAVPSYIRPAPAHVAAWSERLGARRRPRIGIVWSGSASHTNEASRAIGLKRLLPLRSLDVDLIGLQSEVRAEDRAVLDAHPDIRHFDAGFPETAALISLLDLVISVDTSIAHLAGAIGAPTFLLLAHVPDWRWLRDRDDTPWYSSMRLFRQPARGDWDSVVRRVLQECRALVCNA